MGNQPIRNAKILIDSLKNNNNKKKIVIIFSVIHCFFVLILVFNGIVTHAGIQKSAIKHSHIIFILF